MSTSASLLHWWRLLTLCAIALLATEHPGAAADTDRRVNLSLYWSEQKIRERLLEHTPIGSGAEEVTRFVTDRLEHDGVMPPPYAQSAGIDVLLPFAERQPHRMFRTIGTRSIQVHLGDYRDPATLFLLRNRVVARWAFDEQDRLIEILVDKSDIAP